jgi:hypothetical protein
VCSIFMRDGVRGVYTPIGHHMKTLATTFSSQPNPKPLVAYKVLGHPRAVFHPCMCGLCVGADVVAAVLIGYDDVEVAVRTTTRRRRLLLTTSSTPMLEYVGPLL